MSDVSLNSKIVALGISKSYASQIASGRRAPSIPLAIKIYRAIGVKFGPIAHASNAEIGTLERVSGRAA